MMRKETQNWGTEAKSDNGRKIKEEKEKKMKEVNNGTQANNITRNHNTFYVSPKYYKRYRIMNT